MLESDVDCIRDFDDMRLEASSTQSLSSCLKKQDTIGEEVWQSPERHVSFDIIEILEFPLEIGDNPSVSRSFDLQSIAYPYTALANTIVVPIINSRFTMARQSKSDGRQRITRSFDLTYMKSFIQKDEIELKCS